MKKYNLSEIMKSAWNTYRKFKNFVSPLSFAECLRRAWAAAKAATVKVTEITLATVKAAASKLISSGEYESISYREWSNYGMSRIYIKAIRHTLAGNARIADCGYWDLDNSKYVPQAIDLIA
jgi:hypothetical protein